jgi:hypothetical protein
VEPPLLPVGCGQLNGLWTTRQEAFFSEDEEDDVVEDFSEEDEDDFAEEDDFSVDVEEDVEVATRTCSPSGCPCGRSRCP